MYHHKKVSVVIPTYNEAESIRDVVDGFFETGFVDEVVVVDNNALGNTREEVARTKARLVHEPKQGYGNALMRGMQEAQGEIIVMCEADATFRPVDVEKLLSYSRDFDAVLGTRTSREMMWEGAFMPYPVRFGNWLWAKWVEVLFNGPVLTDVGCTYKLISRRALNKIKDLFLLSRGDGTFSPELIIWILRRKLTVVEIPIIYKERVGQSMYTGSVWRAAKLGLKMIPVILRYFFKKI
ncbi:MAG TPA: glycosyltransferase family 2 protein [Candidatus Paceibacterota bacterium]